MSRRMLDPPLITCFLGGGGGRSTSQLLMVSPKWPKTQIAYIRGGGGRGVFTFQLLMQSPVLPKVPFKLLKWILLHNSEKFLLWISSGPIFMQSILTSQAYDVIAFRFICQHNKTLRKSNLFSTIVSLLLCAA